jgi:transcriptional regulator CtsR
VACMTDVIEQHLLQSMVGRTVLELQRSDLAERFRCAPSQINYVLVTRFTPARGFLVESRRGGGGYIRLLRLSAEARDEVAAVPEEIDQATAEQHLARLCEEGLVTAREAAILRAVVSRDVLALPLPLRDRIRAAILRAALCGLGRCADAAEDRAPEDARREPRPAQAPGRRAAREAGGMP